MIPFEVSFVLFDAKDSSQAILIVERAPFSKEKEVWNAIVSKCSLETISQNDIYSSYTLFPPKEFAGKFRIVIRPLSPRFRFLNHRIDLDQVRGWLL